MNNIQVILICQYPLPNKNIASWTTMYNYYLKNKSHPIDYIICPKDVDKIPDVDYSYVKGKSLVVNLRNLRYKKRFNSYFKALDKVIQKENKYIIQIIDNSGIIEPLNLHLKKKYKRKDFYIQYFYHGFDILYSGKNATAFLNGIDEMIFLTKLSYQRYKDYYSELIFRAGIMHNAVSSKLFYKLEASAKQRLKASMGISSQLVFMWCSQDRPKKGLQLILDVWKKIYNGNSLEMQLLIIGVDKEILQEGVIVIGRVPNDELPKYYQVSDFYLFPSLCKEGFGIVLAEALKCGCYCIASNQGGIPEVLAHGEYGKIIENPNFIDEWVEEITNSIKEYINNGYENPYYSDEFDKLYDLDNWCQQMNRKIEEAKLNFSN